jgi:hypothetical protein
MKTLKLNIDGHEIRIQIVDNETITIALNSHKLSLDHQGINIPLALATETSVPFRPIGAWLDN